MLWNVFAFFWHGNIDTFKINNQGVAFKETEDPVFVVYVLYSLLLRGL
jgi:hypothetical protein